MATKKYVRNLFQETVSFLNNNNNNNNNNDNNNNNSNNNNNNNDNNSEKILESQEMEVSQETVKLPLALFEEISAELNDALFNFDD